MTQTYTHRLFIAGAFVCALAIQTNVAHAQQPVISAVTGALTQGTVVTINGSNLNAETRQGWDTWFLRNPNAWSFEGSSPQADGYLDPGSFNSFYDSSFKLLGNKSIKFHSVAVNPDCSTGGKGQSYNYFVLDDPASSTEIWLRAYVSWNRVTNFPTNYLKMLYAMHEGYYFEPGGAANGTNPTTFDSVYSGTSHYASNPSGQIQNKRWYLVELHWKTSSPRAFEAWVDGVRLHQGTPTTGGTQGLGTLLIGAINGCGYGDWDIEHWIDGLAVGHQRINAAAVVEVGDSSNYSTANKKVQALESISDNQISFRLDTSGLGAGPYYVWVRNNAQQLSSGYFLTGGQISGPVAPTNLRIVP